MVEMFRERRRAEGGVMNGGTCDQSLEYCSSNVPMNCIIPSLRSYRDTCRRELLVFRSSKMLKCDVQQFEIQDIQKILFRPFYRSMLKVPKGKVPEIGLVFTWLRW